MRLALVTAAVLALLAAPVVAAQDRLVITHMGVNLAQPLAAGDIIVGVSVWDGATMRPIDGVVLQLPSTLPSICGPSLGPERPAV